MLDRNIVSRAIDCQSAAFRANIASSRSCCLLSSLLLISIGQSLLADGPIAVPNGTVGAAFAYEIKIEGGIPPYAFHLREGSLPPGLELDGSSGKISGTPSATKREAYAFSVSIKDNSAPSQELEQAFTLKVAAIPMHVVGINTMHIVSEPAPTAIVDNEGSGQPRPSPVNQIEVARDASENQVTNDAPADVAKQAGDPTTTTDGFGQDEVVRAVLGFEQVGASGTPSSQNFLFDFFITRPTFNKWIRWWGDVKVASFPQQVNSSLVTFEPQFASTFGGLKVNQLAQNAEFITGPELVIMKPSRFQLTWFAGGGAVGPNNPTDAATVFQLPMSGTPEYTNFVNEFGTPPAGTTTTPVKNVAFLTESSDRFLRQWQTGLRLYTFYNNSKNSLGALPATVEFSVGQNELVTSGHLQGLVGHVAAMYPFTFGTDANKVTVYFFGEATNAYAHPTYAPALPLAPALTNGTPTPLTDPSVYTITVPANHRDTYRIGVGMDLISAVNAIFKSTKQTGSDPPPAK